MHHARVARANTGIPFPTHLKWMKRALCLRKGTENFWLPMERPTPADYREVIETWCKQCPVRPECLLNVMQKELLAKHTSRGVEGGATPSERTALKRKIKESKLCPTEGVWRWLNKKPISRLRESPQRKFTVTLTNKDGTVVYQHAGKTAHGAHTIAVRELRRRGGDLVATVKNPGNKIVDTLTLPIGRNRQRSSPSPGQ